MKKFEQELDELRRQVVAMGNLTESMVAGSIDATFSPDGTALIQKVMADEVTLDRLQLQIDKEAIRLLTVYSPVAGDLRFVLSVSRITAELERMGDHAVNMCENVQLMASRSESGTVPQLEKMANTVRVMVRDALDAFLQGDSRKAQYTVANDDFVDALNDQIVEELLGDDLVKKVIAGSQDIAGALAQLLIARSLERIADQATNISEEVVYMVRGDDIRHAEVADSSGS